MLFRSKIETVTIRAADRATIQTGETPSSEVIINAETGLPTTAIKGDDGKITFEGKIFNSAKAIRKFLSAAGRVVKEGGEADFNEPAD